MLVHVGNADAIESTDGYRTFTSIPGERVTTFRIDDTAQLTEAMSIVVSGLRYMLDPNSSPWWIECEDNLPLQDLLLAHYGLAKDTVRPVGWGDGTNTLKKKEVAER
jgi:hypothetical protein